MDIMANKLEALQKKYCTEKLKKEIGGDELNQDPLIGGVDYTDVEHLKTLKITKDTTKVNAYVVFYITHTLTADYKPTDKKVVLHVTVVQEKGTFKIASVSSDKV
jgi:hypothetical protein